MFMKPNMIKGIVDNINKTQEPMCIPLASLMFQMLV